MKRVVEVADQAGYCFGVRRALDMAKKFLSEHRTDIYSLGPIIHNPQVVDEFRERGLIPVDSLDSVRGGVLVIRSHGVEKDLLEEARRRGLEIVDATCPFVRNAQRLARLLSEEGYQMVIVGEEAHPEVRGIMSYAGGDAIIVKNAAQLQRDSLNAKVGVLAQTTQSLANFKEIATTLLDFVYECRAFNTICNATVSRQAAAIELAGSVDAMFVVGGKNSANTRRLAELCRSACPATYHIESLAEILPDMVRGKERIGITAGASTPRSQVDEVKKVIESSSD
jgi:4-hydroxy-3-methylbut-2-enyl diphosphate reductase